MRAVKLASSIAALFTAIALGTAGHAQELEQVNTVFEREIPNIAGKSLIAVVVTYPAGGKSLSHRHAGSAFIYAHVLSGAIRSQVDDEPAKVYRVGEGFYEVPGSHHRVSENASDREPASLLAVFVVDSKENPLTLPDQKQGSLVYLRVSQINGCAYCIDMHGRDLLEAGVPVEKLLLVSAWEEAGTLFSDQEKAALKWAEVVTRVSDTHVPDEAYAEARATFTEKQLADLTIAVGLIGAYNRLAISFRATPRGRFMSTDTLATPSSNRPAARHLV